MITAETMLTRKSVRSYDGRAVAAETLKKVKEFAAGIENPFGIPVSFVFLDARERGLSSPVLTGETVLRLWAIDSRGQRHGESRTVTLRQTGEEKDTTVMEFVNFADHGDKGAKVVEGWGGVKGPDYKGMQHFQTPEEQANQQAFTDSILNTVLADSDDLQKKYPVVYPTAIPAGDGEKMRDFVLDFINAWNGGAESFSCFAGDFLTEDGVYNVDDTDYTREGLISHSVDVIEKTKEERVRINNILVSDYWAAAHYYSKIVLPDGNRDIKESMEFMHFVKGDKGLMVDRLWLKSGKD